MVVSTEEAAYHTHISCFRSNIIPIILFESTSCRPYPHRVYQCDSDVLDTTGHIQAVFQPSVESYTVALSSKSHHIEVRCRDGLSAIRACVSEFVQQSRLLMPLLPDSPGTFSPGAFHTETRHSPSLSVYSRPTSHADFIAARGLRQLTAASLHW